MDADDEFDVFDAFLGVYCVQWPSNTCSIHAVYQNPLVTHLEYMIRVSIDTV